VSGRDKLQGAEFTVVPATLHRHLSLRISDFTAHGIVGRMTYVQECSYRDFVVEVMQSAEVWKGLS
jgi:hypothetical protein